MAQKLKLHVAGIDYYITTDDDEAYFKAIGAELDEVLDKLSKENPYLSTTMVAVLAAMQYCDESKKVQTKNRELSALLKKAEEEAACACLESDGARREIERLNAENMNLRKRLSGI